MKKKSQLFAIIVCLLAMSLILPEARAQQKLQQQEARRILDATNIKGGLVVHIGCGDGRLTVALRANDSYLVHGLDADTQNLEKARRYINSLGWPKEIDEWTHYLYDASNNAVANDALVRYLRTS